MATQIPLSGELIVFEAPTFKAALDDLCRPLGGGTRRIEWKSGDGEVFFFHAPVSGPWMPTNFRARQFIDGRGGGDPLGIDPQGLVIYLSKAEWDGLGERELAALSGSFPRPAPKFAEIGGRTYPVREQLKALGGVWDATKRVWRVPEDRKDEALALVDSRPAQVIGKPKSRSTWSCFDCGISIGPLEGMFVDENERRVLKCSDRVACMSRRSKLLEAISQPPVEFTGLPEDLFDDDLVRGKT